MPRKRQPEPMQVQENPFGEFTDEQLAGDPIAPDRFYIKGYSDKRHQREVDIREGRKPQTLEHRFQLVSVERENGTPVKNKLVEFRAKGYKTVMWEEAGSYGLDLEGSAAEKGADGSVRIGSQMLMVAGKELAAKLFREQRLATERQFDNLKAQLQEKADTFNEKYGYTGRTGTKFEVETHETSTTKKIVKQQPK